MQGNTHAHTRMLKEKSKKSKKKHSHKHTHCTERNSLVHTVCESDEKFSFDGGCTEPLAICMDVFEKYRIFSVRSFIHLPTTVSLSVCVCVCVRARSRPALLHKTFKRKKCSVVAVAAAVGGVCYP